MFRLIAAILAGIIAFAGSAHAAELTPIDIVNRHGSAGGNIDAIMQDYADDAIVLQAGRAVQGKAAIREVFAKMFPARPVQAPAVSGSPSAPSRPAGGMKVTRVWQEGDIGLMTWEAGPVHATEEFIVKSGKIQVQAIFMSR